MKCLCHASSCIQAKTWFFVLYTLLQVLLDTTLINKYMIWNSVSLILKTIMFADNTNLFLTGYDMTTLELAWTWTFTNPVSPPPTVQNFNPATLEEIRKFVFTSSNSQCKLDVIPTDLLKEYSTLKNSARSSPHWSVIHWQKDERFPSIFKNAHERPLSKKPSFPPEDLNNYRPMIPISNLNFISKILEKVVASRTGASFQLFLGGAKKFVIF